MTFVAVDVETANADRGSICSIGLVAFDDNRVVEEWYMLIDPCDAFDPINTSIHGIDAQKVRGAPTYAEVAQTINRKLHSTIAVAHSSFDFGAIRRASDGWECPQPRCHWLDTACVARRAWPELPNHKLPTLCEHIGFAFQHHHALEDAKAAGHILLAATQEAGLGLDDWLRRVKQPINRPSRHSLRARQSRRPCPHPQCQGPLQKAVSKPEYALTP